MNFMKKIILILIFSAILLIDKSSGQISIVEDSKIITLRIDNRYSKRKHYQVLSKTKTWNSIIMPQLGTLIISLKTRWIDGNLYFICTVKPLEPQKYPGIRYFSLILLDSDGFVIIKKRIDINNMDIFIDGQGHFAGILINSSIPCTAETYLSIEDWSFDLGLF
jgi:hypothetical protein